MNRMHVAYSGAKDAPPPCSHINQRALGGRKQRSASRLSFHQPSLALDQLTSPLGQKP